VDKLIYTDLAAMRGAMARQTAIAHNLANAVTPGFRADLAQARAVWVNSKSGDTRIMPTESINAADMSSGAIAHTGRTLDISMNGDSMLAVQAEDGTESYTRRGDLQISASGLLTTGDGYPVIGKSGPVTIVNADSISIDTQGRISTIAAGGNPQIVDILKIVSPSGQSITKSENGLFISPSGTLPEDPDARILPGALEGSNVMASEELVSMIEASRSWDNQLKLLTSARELDSSTTDLMKISE
jgi:flagellar basal-body rod protein FlgF